VKSVKVEQDERFHQDMSQCNKAFQVSGTTLCWQITAGYFIAMLQT